MRDTAAERETEPEEPQAVSARLRRVVRSGVRSGLRTAWELAVIVVPIYWGVTILKHTFVMAALAHALAPAMKFLLLPGEAAVAIVAGIVIGIYAALGAAASLALSPQQTTIVGFIVVTAHALPMESAILSRMGARGGRISFLRLVAAFVGAALISRLIVGR
jgi:spore maturation protein SpmB